MNTSGGITVNQQYLKGLLADFTLLIISLLAWGSLVYALYRIMKR